MVAQHTHCPWPIQVKSALTGNITISECQHLSGFVDDDVKRLFRSVPTSGRVVKIVADSIFIAESQKFDVGLSN